jgi:aspartyl-tRNA(Asn)/glutamyl-tRNA(Gln) amidotransferase subunit C
MNIKDVEDLANLARIELGEEEKKGLLSDMDSILGYVKQIEEMKIENIEPEYEVCNIWREDLPAVEGELIPREFSREIITEQFPDAQDGFLKVKKIL